MTKDRITNTTDKSVSELLGDAEAVVRPLTDAADTARWKPVREAQERLRPKCEQARSRLSLVAAVEIRHRADLEALDNWTCSHAANPSLSFGLREAFERLRNEARGKLHAISETQREIPRLVQKTQNLQPEDLTYFRETPLPGG